MKKQKLKLFLALVLISTVSGIATAKPTKSHPKKITHQPLSAETLLKATTARYRKSGMVEMSVEKRISTEWKPKEDVSSGKMFYSKGKIRWEIDSPEKNWTIYDGKIWWNIEFATVDFGDSKNKVSRTLIQKKSKDQFFLLDLLDSKDPASQFLITTKEVTEKTSKDPQSILSLNAKKSLGISDIQLVIQTDKKIFKQISFKDDIGNVTKINLGTPKFEKKTKESLFKYKPNLEKDQVSDL